MKYKAGERFTSPRGGASAVTVPTPVLKSSPQPLTASAPPIENIVRPGWRRLMASRITPAAGQKIPMAEVAHVAGGP